MRRYNDIPIAHNDEVKTLPQWACHLGMDYSILLSRYIRGKRGAELFRQTRKYKRKQNKIDEYALPRNLTRNDALLGALDDYHRHSVQYYSKQMNMSELEFVSECLEHIYKKLERHERKQSNP